MTLQSSTKKFASVQHEAALLSISKVRHLVTCRLIDREEDLYEHSSVREVQGHHLTEVLLRHLAKDELTWRKATDKTAVLGRSQDAPLSRQGCQRRSDQW